MESSDKIETSECTVPGFGGVALSRSQFLGRAAALTASGTMLATLLGCGSSGDASGTAAKVGSDAGSPPKVPTGTFTFGLIAAPATLDQALVGDTGSTQLCCVVSETLVRPNRDNTGLDGVLATSWESSADAREWTFKLREGVTFHDGAPFDSTAVKKTFEHDKEAGGFASILVPDWSELDDSDPAVLRIVAKTPSPDLARNLTYVWMMSPKHLAAGRKALGKTQVGTGPYRMTGQSTTEVRLEANPDYWGEGPYFAQVVMAVSPDAGALFNQLQTGAVDLVREVPAAQVVQLRSNPKVQVLTNANSQRMAYAAIKTALAPVDDVRIRKAIAYAMDRDTIAKSVLRGLATPAVSYEPKANFGYAPMDPAYPFDAAKAKALIAEAGGGSPQLRMATVAGATDDLGQAIAQQLRDVGFEVQVDSLEEGVFGAETGELKPRHHIHITQHGWVGGGPLIYSLRTMTSLSNLDRTDPQATKAIEAAAAKMDRLPDGPDRLAAIAKLQDLLAEQLPYISIAQMSVTDVVSARTQGYRNDGNSIADLRPVYLSS